MQCMKLGVVLLLTAALASGCGDGSVGSRAGGPDVPVPAGLEDGCPAWDAPIRYADGDLPEGAVSVRLCPGPPIVAYDGSIYDVGIQPPEVLTTRVGELVDAVNALEAIPAETACERDAGPRLTYWFTYPDGDARAVTFETSAARSSSSARTGSAQVATGSRSCSPRRCCPSGPRPLRRREPSRRPTAVACGPSRPPLCLRSQSTSRRPASVSRLGLGRFGRREVPTELLAELDRGLLADEVPWEGARESDRPFAHLLGYTDWGDLVRYVLDRLRPRRGAGDARVAAERRTGATAVAPSWLPGSMRSRWVPSSATRIRP